MNNAICQASVSTRPYKLKSIECDDFFNSVNVVETNDPIKTLARLHKLSYDELPGGALIVTDLDLSNVTWHNCKRPRMLDTLSFCRNKMHFELMGRPPVIIFNTKVSLDEIRIALFSKTGFSKSTEFTAYYVKHNTKFMPTLVERIKNFFR
ncbi:hypothetical protein OFDDKENP_00059 [Aeromonas phage B614]|nr:hypothetical protein OFDDKENP_00059 [Aeromonas phage B614]UYD58578.1 hypothetical protein IPAKJDPM_00235 [Aeromonas phage avDM14-QBC]UYD58792.1 hypothetical protein HNNIDBEH_00199 [Aeromonas phage avDM10-HWA]UYD58904.1 hypothetical protein OFOPOMKI_00054 [Aeromonas phage avDM7-IJDJ]